MHISYRFVIFCYFFELIIDLYPNLHLESCSPSSFVFVFESRSTLVCWKQCLGRKRCWTMKCIGFIMIRAIIMITTDNESFCDLRQKLKENVCCSSKTRKKRQPYNRHPTRTAVIQIKTTTNKMTTKKYHSIDLCLCHSYEMRCPKPTPTVN